MQRIDRYGMFSDAVAMLPTTDADDHCPLPVNQYDNMGPTPFIRYLPAVQRFDRYAKMFSDACAMLLTTDAVNKCIDESIPPSSSKGQVTVNAESNTGMLTNLNHKDLDASFETVKEESIYDHDSTESSNPLLNHNTQKTSFVFGSYRTPQHWLMHPSFYDEYMNRYLDMPFEFEVDSAPSLPSLGPSYGVVNDVAPDLAEIVKQIEYYFSFDNLINDVNFQEHMVGHGWFPLPYVASLSGMRKLTSNVEVIAEAVRTSFTIEMDDGKYIRNRHIFFDKKEQ
ncbi:hypothetical protein K1719_001990 [Acacia pycnantha]|nr:hypothetical protein K1719_001540 [Acacia pycnantha]KAI9127431.1 hypothetical protein K1719_001990 [Acacia pycnantha]